MTLTDSSPKKIYRWQISKWKDVSHHTSSEKYKWKQRDTTTHLLNSPNLKHWQHQWPKSETVTTLTNAGENVEQQELSYVAFGNAKGTAMWKTVWFFPELNIHCTIQQSHSLVFTQRELKTYVHVKTCTWIFIAALFIIVKIWKHPRRPSIGEWIHKLWYIQTTEYYSALKRNELSSHDKTGRNLKCLSTKWKEPIWKGYCTVWFQLYDILEKAKIWRQ